jgi:hypothetical protein
MDPFTRSVAIVAAAVIVQMALGAWQQRAGVEYLKLYEICTGRRALYREGDPHPIMLFLRPSLGEPNVFKKQDNAMLEQSRLRYMRRRNIFVAGTLLDWALLTLLLNVNTSSAG